MKKINSGALVLLSVFITIGFLVAIPQKTIAVSQSFFSSTVFKNDLTIGSYGYDVTALQAFIGLNLTSVQKSYDDFSAEQFSYNLTVGTSTSKIVYSYFGPKTQSELADYQRSKGITPANGYFGPLTRSAVNSDIASKANTYTGIPKIWRVDHNTISGGDIVTIYGEGFTADTVVNLRNTQSSDDPSSVGTIQGDKILSVTPMTLVFKLDADFAKNYYPANGQNKVVAINVSNSRGFSWSTGISVLPPSYFPYKTNSTYYSCEPTTNFVIAASDINSTPMTITASDLGTDPNNPSKELVRLYGLNHPDTINKLYNISALCQDPNRVVQVVSSTKSTIDISLAKPTTFGDKLYSFMYTYGPNNSSFQLSSFGSMITLKGTVPTSQTRLVGLNEIDAVGSNTYNIDPYDGVKNAPLYSFKLRSDQGNSTITSLSVTTFSLQTPPSTLYLYVGSSTLLSSKSWNSGYVTFDNLNYQVNSSTTQLFTVKGDFPSNGISTSTVALSSNTINYKIADGSSLYVVTLPTGGYYQYFTRRSGRLDTLQNNFSTTTNSVTTTANTVDSKTIVTQSSTAPVVISSPTPPTPAQTTALVTANAPLPTAVSVTPPTPAQTPIIPTPVPTQITKAIQTPSVAPVITPTVGPNILPTPTIQKITPVVTAASQVVNTSAVQPSTQVMGPIAQPTPVAVPNSATSILSPDAPPLPVAKLVANGQAGTINVKVGDTINYEWSSMYAQKGESLNSSSCGTGLWYATDTGNKKTDTILPSQAGCSYTILYVVTQTTTGKTARAQIIVNVAPITTSTNTSADSYTASVTNAFNWLIGSIKNLFK